MIRRADTRVRAVAIAMALAIGLMPVAAGAVVLTGEVQVADSQPIHVPPSDSSPVVLRYYVPDGHAVKPGDVVLRIDPGESVSQIRTLDAQIEQTRAKVAKDLAELRVRHADAQIALVDAQAALATARLDAAIPGELISRLDYERHQGELDRAGRELVLKRKELGDARAAMARRQRDGQLEVEKLTVERAYHAAYAATAEVRAKRPGIVVHGFSSRQRESGRIDEGASAHPGETVGQVVGGGAMRVRAWALEPDRRGLTPGQSVALSFDAVPGRPTAGRIASISGAPDRKPEWGQGRYFTLDIDLVTPAPGRLLPGMSVRVVAMPATGSALGASR